MNRQEAYEALTVALVGLDPEALDLNTVEDFARAAKAVRRRRRDIAALRHESENATRVIAEATAKLKRIEPRLKAATKANDVAELMILQRDVASTTNRIQSHRSALASIPSQLERLEKAPVG